MNIHTERKNQNELERVHERNFENPKMRQILLFLAKFVYASNC